MSSLIAFLVGAAAGVIVRAATMVAVQRVRRRVEAEEPMKAEADPYINRDYVLRARARRREVEHSSAAAA